MKFAAKVAFTLSLTIATSSAAPLPAADLAQTPSPLSVTGASTPSPTTPLLNAAIPDGSHTDESIDNIEESTHHLQKRGNHNTPPNAAMQRIFNYHNQVRAIHGVPPLQWSSDLAKSSNKWAPSAMSRGQLKHSGFQGLGENLAWYKNYPEQRAIDSATSDWYNEINMYDYTPTPNPKTYHFTQMIWKATTSVGCAADKRGREITVVCHYYPQGNIMGQFQANVPRRLNEKSTAPTVAYAQPSTPPPQYSVPASTPAPTNVTPAPAPAGKLSAPTEDLLGALIQHVLTPAAETPSAPAPFNPVSTTPSAAGVKKSCNPTKRKNKL